MTAPAMTPSKPPKELAEGILALSRVDARTYGNIDEIMYTARKLARAFLDSLKREERATALCEQLKLEAQCHAQEARTANATIHGIYPCAPFSSASQRRSAARKRGNKPQCNWLVT